MSSEYSLEDLLRAIASERGVDFRAYKRSTLERRIRKRMFDIKAGSYAEYADRLRADADEINELLNTVLINVTEFFRDPQAWEVLRRDVLPNILRDRQPGETVRCWSAGCATGEEVYSIAILLAEYFGPRLSEYDVKIYATDIDEDALNAARRAEYSPDRLRRVRPEWRKRYFTGDGVLRVNRDLRRLCIFGRSNILSDAPISHVDLALCRNLLIYFDARSQTQILTRLHYALEPYGVLFIGKASSLVGAADLFRPIHSKYRIFQRADAPTTRAIAGGAGAEETATMATRDDTDSLRLQHAALLETLGSGVLLLDGSHTVLSENAAARQLWNIKSPLTGKPVTDTELGSLCPDLGYHLEQSQKTTELINFQCSAGVGSHARTLSMTLKPILNPTGERLGTVVYMEDFSPREKLQSTIEELEATGEELQSANEELETTNEELQSANEELETTNEELQSTNEELETTNEELQSLNEELQTANEELAVRGTEMDEMNRRYAETLERMPWPVMVVGDKLKIEFWNSGAQQMFGFDDGPPANLRLEQLPLPPALRSRIMRRYRSALARNAGSVLRGEVLDGPKARTSMNIHFTLLAGNGPGKSVLIMFEVTARSSVARPQSVRARRQKARAAKSGKSNPGPKRRK